MKISEYTQRVTPNLSQTTKSNLQMPSAVSKNTATDLGRNLLQTTSELGDVYLEMKDQRDKAIANDFMNHYSVDSTTKINELKQIYKGSKANQIIPEFEKWSDDYFSQRQGQGDDEQTVYIENNEQLNYVRKQYDSDRVNRLNSLSHYQASEEDSYRKNSFLARVSNISESMALDTDQANLVNNMAEIKDLYNSQYIGQSPEYISSLVRKTVQPSFETNAKQNITTNPQETLRKLNSPLYKSNIDEASWISIHNSALIQNDKLELQNIAQSVPNAMFGTMLGDKGAIENYISSYEKTNSIYSNSLMKPEQQKTLLNQMNKDIANQLLFQVGYASNSQKKQLYDNLKNGSVNGVDLRKIMPKNVYDNVLNYAKDEVERVEKIQKDNPYMSDEQVSQQAVKMANEKAKLEQIRSNVFDLDGTKITGLRGSLEDAFDYQRNLIKSYNGGIISKTDYDKKLLEVSKQIISESAQAKGGSDTNLNVGIAQLQKMSDGSFTDFEMADAVSELANALQYSNTPLGGLPNQSGGGLTSNQVIKVAQQIYSLQVGKRTGQDLDGVDAYSVQDRIIKPALFSPQETKAIDDFIRGSQSNNGQVVQSVIMNNILGLDEKTRSSNPFLIQGQKRQPSDLPSSVIKNMKIMKNKETGDVIRVVSWQGNDYNM